MKIRYFIPIYYNHITKYWTQIGNEKPLFNNKNGEDGELYECQNWEEHIKNGVVREITVEELVLL